MTEEKNAAGTDSENTGTTDEASARGINPVSPGVSGQDDYYTVDHAKKDVLSTIGDGEMRDEGLAGAGDALTDLLNSPERFSDEQDQAELRDSQQ